MKKISFIMNQEEFERLQELREYMKAQTGMRMSVSELLRGLVMRESQKIDTTTPLLTAI